MSTLAATIDKKITTEMSEETELKIKEEHSHKLGHKIADELLARLKKAVAAKQIEELINIRSTLLEVMKTAYQNNQAEIFAHIIKNCVEFCRFAAETKSYDKIVIALGLRSEELETLELIIKTFDKDALGKIAFFIINLQYLEKFSEELNLNKNSISSFKERVYDALEKQGLICRPSIKNLEELQKTLAKEMPDILTLADEAAIDARLVQIGKNYSELLDFPTFEYLYLNNQPKLLAQFVLTVICPVIDLYRQQLRPVKNAGSKQENELNQKPVGSAGTIAAHSNITANGNSVTSSTAINSSAPFVAAATNNKDVLDSRKDILDSKAIADGQYQNDKMQLYFIRMAAGALEANNTQLMVDFMSHENKPLIFYIFSIFLLGNIARKNNSSALVLKTFTDQLLSEGAKVLGKKALLPTWDEVNNHLTQALQVSDLNQLKSSIAQTYLLFCEAFRVKDKAQCVKVLSGVCQTAINNPSMEKLLSGHSMKFDLSSDEISFMIKNKRFALMLWYVLDGLAISESLAPLFNMQEAEVLDFKKHLFNSDVAYKHVELFNDIHFLIKQASQWMENKPSKYSLPEITFEIEAMLRDALEHHEDRHFASIIEALLQFSVKAHQKKQDKFLIEIFEWKPHQVAPFFHALDKNDPILLGKLITDFILRDAIETLSEQSKERVSEFYITDEKIRLEREKLEKYYINFQMRVYAWLGVKNSSENLGNILPYTKSNRLEQSGFRVSPEAVVGEKPSETWMRVYKPYYGEKYNKLAQCFQTKDYKQFAEVLVSIQKDLTQILMTEGYNKLCTALSLYAHNSDGNTSGYRIEVNQSRIQYIALLLEKVNLASFAYLRPSLYFELMDLLDFDTFVYYDAQKRIGFGAFKIQIIEMLSNGLGLVLPSQKHLDEWNKLAEQQPKSIQKYLSCNLLGSHIKYHLLKAQLGGRAGIMSAKNLSHLVQSIISLNHASYNAGELELRNSFFGLTPSQKSALFSLFKPEQAGLLAWVLLDSKFFVLFAKENGIDKVELNTIKTLIYNSLSEKPGFQPGLLMAEEDLKQKFEVAFKKADADELQLWALHGIALLGENLKARNYQDFAKVILMLLPYLKQFPVAHSLIANMLDWDEEEIKTFCVLLNENEQDLILYFLINSAIQQHSQEIALDPTLEVQHAATFMKALQAHLTGLGISMLRDPAQVAQINQKQLDETHSKNLIINEHFIKRIQLETYYLLRHAVVIQDCKQFAEIIKNMIDFVMKAYTAHQGSFLIRLLDLNSSEIYLSDDRAVYRYIPKLHAETLFKCLDANDRNGITQLFIDHFLEIASSSTQKYHSSLFVDTNFKIAIYDALGIVPLNLYNPQFINVEKEKTFIVTALKDLANKGLKFEQYGETLERFSKSQPIVAALIPPTASDSDNYKTLYKNMKKIWMEHLLAHRFGVRDEQLEGSYAVTMASELQKAFVEFMKNPAYAKTLEDIRKTAFSDLNEAAWKHIVDSIQQDIADILLQSDNEKLQKRLSQAAKVSGQDTVAIPVFLNSKDSEKRRWAHLTGAVFFSAGAKHYCMLSDRGGVIDENYKNSGITLYSVAKPENIVKAAQLLHKSNESDFTVDHFNAAIEPLTLQKIFHIKKKIQKSGNCGWSSSAKTLLCSISFANFFKQFAKNDPKVLDEALNAANRVALMFYKSFSGTDRVLFLQSYLDFCKTNGIEVHLHMLAQIFLKSEHRKHRQDIVQMIAPLKLKDENIKVAQEVLLKTFFELVLGFSGIQSFLDIDLKFLSEHAKTIMNAYLKHEKEEVLIKLVEAAVKALHEKYPEKVIHNKTLLDNHVATATAGSAGSGGSNGSGSGGASNDKSASHVNGRLYLNQFNAKPDVQPNTNGGELIPGAHVHKVPKYR